MIRSFYSNAGDRAEQKVVTNFNRRGSAADVPDDTTEPESRLRKAKMSYNLRGTAAVIHEAIRSPGSGGHLNGLLLYQNSLVLAAPQLSPACH